VVWRVVCVGLLLLVMVELHFAQRNDGESLRCLRSVFASVIFVFLFPLASVIDRYTDISPGFVLRPILEDWVWLGYAVLATSVIRFLAALHQWRIRKDKSAE
jgi:hypothetical protein